MKLRNTLKEGRCLAKSERISWRNIKHWNGLYCRKQSHLYVSLMFVSCAETGTHLLPCHSGASRLRGERFVSVMGNIWLSFTLSLYFVSWGGEVRTSPGKDNEGEFTLWNYNFSSATTFLVLVLSFSTFCCSNDCSFWIFCLSGNYKAPVFEAAFLTKPSILCSLLSSLSRDRS